MHAIGIKSKTVADILTRDPVSVTRDTSASELAHVLDANEISGVPVVDRDDRVIGVVSRTDLLHRCVECLFEPGLERLDDVLSDTSTAWDPSGLGTVEEFMSAEPIMARVDEPLEVVARRLVGRAVHRAVVVAEDGRVLGIVTTMDMLRAVAATSPNHS